MASSSDQTILNGQESTLTSDSIDYESLVVVDEFVEKTVEDSDGEIQFIGEFNKGSTKNRKRPLDESKDVTVSDNSVSSSIGAKRQKVDEILVTRTTVQEVEISEPWSEDSPDITENEVDFIYNVKSEERFVTKNKKHGKPR